MKACPICESAAPPYPGNTYAPFCSKRCKLVDLGAWIDEGYRVPTEDELDPGAVAAGAGSDRSLS
jgi:hypothetical protein